MEWLDILKYYIYTANGSNRTQWVIHDENANMFVFLETLVNKVQEQLP